MRNQAKSILLISTFASFLLGARAFAQADFGVHSHLAGQTYEDDKIRVAVPPDWTVAVDSATTTGARQLAYDKGATLRHGRYILTLCTSCGQASGVRGGRFSEIAGMVQPWYRDEAPALPCGDQETSKASSTLDRVDFWYTRKTAHPSNVANNDCHEPRTTATVWYGSYFTQHCTKPLTDEECGGFFLVNMTSPPPSDGGLNEMVFALTYETMDPNELPHSNDPELAKILAEANAIVASLHYHK
jgi:hypothetical protein